MKSQVYNHAKYYEIAFNFTDIKEQVNLFEKFIKEYSKSDVKNVLDIACGPALQLREFAKRGYDATGIDSNEEMLSYLKNQSNSEKIDIKTECLDMNNFKLEKNFDFAYILMGSIIYAKNNKLLDSHLTSVANALTSGSLYLIENLAINWADSTFFEPQTWEMEENDIKVKTTYQIKPNDALKQIVTQSLKLEVNDNNEKVEFVDSDDLKIIFPEEFKLIIEKNNKFDFLGFYERESTKKLEKMSADNIVLLRKK